MSNYVNDMWPGSPQQSPAASGRSSRLSSAARSRSRSSRSSRSRSSVSSRWSSRSRSRPRCRSRSRSRRRHQRRCRRYSRSYSRSRSGSRSRRRFRERHRRSPSSGRSCSRSRSRSRGRSYYRRAYAVARGRRHHGFGRTPYPEERRRWRARSRSRTRSPTPFRLSEKDRLELLEIAKANVAKALGTTNFELPPSLRIVPVSKETNRGTAVSNNGAKFELSGKLIEVGTKNANEKSSQQKSISSDNSVAKPMLQKPVKATTEETSSGSLKVEQKKSPYGLWKPI